MLTESLFQLVLESRGIDGKIEAITYARTNRVPFFGISLGMQLAAVEYARNVMGIKDAHSAEFDKDTTNQIIESPAEINGNMEDYFRLGVYPCKLKEGTKARAAYGEELIYERHRNRFEFNNEYREQFEAAGMTLSGISPNDQLVEIIELEDHPFFVGVSFHPEFASRPTRPQPLFREFIGAVMAGKE